MNARILIRAVVVGALAVMPGLPAAAPSPSPTTTPIITKASRPPIPKHSTATSRRSMRIMALGDSITVGIGSSDGNGFRGRLEPLLQDEIWIGPEGTPPLMHAGRSGWRIHQWLPEVPGLISYAPGVILIDLGTNDAGQNQNESAAQMLDEMRQLLDGLRPTNAAMFVAQPCLPTVNTAAQNAALNTFDDQLPGLVAQYPRTYTVDMRGLPLQDGVHPNNVGYDIMTQRWLAALQAAGLS